MVECRDADANSDADLDAVFAALSHSARRDTLDALGRGARSAGELAAPHGMTLAGFMKHLRALEAAGLVACRKQGRTLTCTLTEAPLQRASQWLAGRGIAPDRLPDHRKKAKEGSAMPLFDNVLASLAVKDLKAAVDWYSRLLDSPGSSPMPEVAEWRFPRGGCLQVYLLPGRAGQGSCTIVTDDIDAAVRKLDAMGVDTRQRTSGERVRTVMVTDPDGNHLAFAQALDPTLAR